ncbi:hypothetical protein KBD59_04280 [Candidatus Gracilibacteria bacterium]|nr:hypothetical protein [Candidatus Gracilibacteria bacterium]
MTLNLREADAFQHEGVNYTRPAGSGVFQRQYKTLGLKTDEVLQMLVEADVGQLQWSARGAVVPTPKARIATGDSVSIYGEGRDSVFLELTPSNLSQTGRPGQLTAAFAHRVHRNLADLLS